MTRILITGMSGTGKSTVIEHLADLGHTAVELDSSSWSEWAVPPGGDPAIEHTTEPDWIWREDRVRHLLGAARGETLYVSGCAPNQGRFYPHFDHVVLLTAPIPVMMKRIATRTTNGFGKRPGEREKIAEDTRLVLPLLRAGADIEIDTDAASVDEVVAAILALGRGGRAPD